MILLEWFILGPIVGFWIAMSIPNNHLLFLWTYHVLARLSVLN